MGRVTKGPPPIPQRGEVWRANLDPVVGHEQGRIRPVLVVSQDRFNTLPSRLVVIVPLTRRTRRYPYEVTTSAGEANLADAGIIRCDQARTVSHDRLSRRFGMVSAETLAEVDIRIKRVFGY